MIVRKVALVAATPTLITTTGFGDPLKISNIGPGTLYIGGDASVLDTNGFKVTVYPNLYSEIDLNNYGGQVWGYASGGACDVRVIEQYSG